MILSTEDNLSNNVIKKSKKQLFFFRVYWVVAKADFHLRLFHLLGGRNYSQHLTHSHEQVVNSRPLNPAGPGKLTLYHELA